MGSDVREGGSARHAQSFVERLQTLCRMPSVAARGTGMRAIAETVEQMMQRVGIGTRSHRPA